MGHTLLQVSINAQPPAWFILDSGASGFVVNDRAPHAVQALEGDGAQVAGISGKVCGREQGLSGVEVVGAGGRGGSKGAGRAQGAWVLVAGICWQASAAR
jgi:hypothetical protein